MPAPSWLMMGLIALSLGIGPEASAKRVSPMRAFHHLPVDPPPVATTRDSHYWISNELHLEVFHDDLVDRKGAYIGVGTDQNYMLAAWAQSELMVLMDFDQRVVDLHEVYRIAFNKAETKEEFRRLWSKESERGFREVISSTLGGDKRARPYVSAYQIARKKVDARFERIDKYMQKAGVKTFLSDDDQYQHIRKLYLTERVFAVSGNLLLQGTMQAIAKALNGVGMEVGVLYLSNAEQYFEMPAIFRDNVISLPANEKSVVVRTSGRPSLATKYRDRYHYNLQGLQSLQAFAADKKTFATAWMLKQATPTEVYGYTHLFGDPAPSYKEARKRSRARQRRERKLKKRRDARYANEIAKRNKSFQRRKERRAARKGRTASQSSRSSTASATP